MDLIWKRIKDFPNYFVSNNGDVKSLKKTLKPLIGFGGRLKVNLYKNKKMKQVYISRLVADNFVKNPKNRPNVDHIDRNVKNNNFKNLKWVNQKENLLNKNTVKYRSYMIGNKKGVDVALQNGISKETFYRRIRRGWSVSEASLLLPHKYTFRKRKMKGA